MSDAVGCLFALKRATADDNPNGLIRFDHSSTFVRAAVAPYAITADLS
jgi:hypothetical protein